MLLPASVSENSTTERPRSGPDASTRNFPANRSDRPESAVLEGVNERGCLADEPKVLIVDLIAVPGQVERHTRPLADASAFTYDRQHDEPIQRKDRPDESQRDGSTLDPVGAEEFGQRIGDQRDEVRSEHDRLPRPAIDV